MARPIVLVFQELANTSIVPVTPDLQTIVVGPAYVINDYPDDAANILLSSAYGTLDGPAKTAGSSTAYQPPAANVTTIIVTAYPNNAAGAVVDHSSVQLWLKLPRVIMGSTYLSSGVAPVIGSAITTSNGTPDALNKITFAPGNDLAVTFGVQSGDIIDLTDSAGNNLKRTVLSVGEGGVTPNALRVTQNLPNTGGWVFDASGGARIERQLATQQVIDTNGTILVFPEPTSNTLNIQGGIKLNVVVGNATVGRTVSYSQCYLAYRAIRQDLQHVDSCDVTEIPLKVGKIDARNPLAVGLFCALQNSGSVRILFYGVSSNDAFGHAKFRDAVSAQKDLYSVVPLTADTSTLLSYKIDCETLADPTIASDTGVVQKFRMLLGSGTLPVETTQFPGSTESFPVQSGASSGKHRTIHIKAPVVSLTALLPGDAVTIGIVPGGGTWSGRRGTHLLSHLNDATHFEILPSNVAWNDSSDDDSGVNGGNPGVEIQITNSTGSVVKYSKLASLDTTFGASVLTVAHRSPVVSGGPYQIAFVGGAGLAVTLSGFDITVTFVIGVTTAAQAVAAIQAADDVNAVITSSTTGGGDNVTAQGMTPLALTAAQSGLETLINDNYYDILEDDGATFLSSGVLPGDIIEIPANPNDYSNSAFAGAFTSYVVAQVISENRIQVTPTSDDTPSIATELPHGYSRSGSGLIDVTPPLAVRYRVQRQLTKDDQVTALIAYAQSFMSKRAALVWPDLCLVAGLVDGSLPRSSPLVPQPAGPQPGYYAACVVGGAMAGLPAQQGLTNLAFAGLTSVTHATDYFTDPQITKISDGGWLVLQQDNPIAAPYCIHQLTTNPSAVETGEISVVKDVDFISLFLMGILQTFIGVYNVTEDTLSEINRAVVQGMENLKLRKVARIGPPLIDGKVTSLAVSTISSDRVEIFLDLQVPRPLNRIGLHLVV